MKKVITLSLFALALLGCRAQPASNDSSVASTYFHPYGFAVAQQEWVDRGQNGKVISHLKSASIQTIHYENGERHGLAEWTFPYTNIICKSEEYSHGKLIKQTDHYPSGAPKKQINFINDSDQQVTTWYEDGSPQSQETWNQSLLIKACYFDRNGKIESSVVDGHGQRIQKESDHIVAKEQYNEGWLCSRDELFPNGQLSAQLLYEKGKQNGLTKRFNPQGSVIATEQWLKGERHGLVEEFVNGQKVSEIPFKAGLKHGQEKRFREGELVETLEWLDGKKYGPHKMMVNGEAVKVEYYYFDIPVSKISFENMIR